MAKKKTKKKEVSGNVEEKRSGTRTIDWPEAHNQLVSQIYAINKRIDKIVANHESCKSLKGL